MSATLHNLLVYYELPLPFLTLVRSVRVGQKLSKTIH
jgi:hypothetical protein